MKKEIEKKREILLVIDANEGADNRTEVMSELIHECGLVDTHLIRDQYTEIETYARGKEKTDYISTTTRIQQSVTYAHIAPYNETIESDHMALIVDIDYKLLEAGELIFWQRPERTFTSISLANRKKFVEECHEKGKKTKLAAQNPQNSGNGRRRCKRGGPQLLGQ